MFSPKITTMSADALSSFFFTSAQWILSIIVGLLPLWFIPYTEVSIGFTKSVFVVAGVYGALILAVLALLRSGKVSLYRSSLLLSFWLFTGAMIISALLSGDTFDALFGVSWSVHSAYFTLLMATVMTAALVFVGAKRAVVRTLIVLATAFAGVFLFSLTRFIGGPELLSFGVFSSNIVTLVGGLNDLALYAGLYIVMLLVSVYALPTNPFARTIAVLLTIASLAILAVVNFSFVWYVVGFFALLTFLYLIARDTWLRGEGDSAPVSRFTLTLVASICIFSGAFIVSGDYLGARVASLTGINYLEVRPSNLATVDVAKSVYQENAFTGVGPNRFEDAWRLYKDPVINETQFWATNFVSGNSYALTVLATTGIVGVVGFIAFIFIFLLTGYRLVFADRTNEQSWGGIGAITFTAAAYLWVMTFWYTPGATVLLLAAFFTGLMVVVRESERGVPVVTVNVAHSRQYGFLLIASSLVLIVVATNALITVIDRYQAEVLLVKSANAYALSGDSAAYDSALQAVSQSMPDQDVYVTERARLRLGELNRLAAQAELADGDQQRFETLLVEGVRLAELAIAVDKTNPFNYALLASFYGLINPSQFEGIAERRDSALSLAIQYDPLNPEYRLLSGQAALRFGDTASAREAFNAALALKGNYTDALFLLSQIDVQEGNATSAIAMTRSIITIEPYNPGRRYQLGLLLLAIGELEPAAQAFQEAVILDQNYANARYMLALTYLDLGLPDQALEQLKIVALTNPDNTALTSLISQLESGVTPPEVSPSAIAEPATVQGSDQVVTVNPPDTDLVTPVNRVPQETAGAETIEEEGEVVGN